MATTRSHPRVRTRLKTQNLNHNVVYDAPTSTPISRGTSVRKRQEDDADKDVRFKREDYDDYIREDFESRVFVDFEVFMKTVLHVPDNWKDAWGPAIEEVKTDTRFTKCHREYCEKCDQPGLHEKSFYEPFVDTANAVLTVLSESQFAVPDIASESESGGIAVTTPQYYRVNDPKKLLGGVINKNNLSPDLVVLHDDCRPPKERKHHWANPLHVLEVKPYDSAICDGENITRLISNGIDPILNHAPPPSPARYRADKAAKEATPIATPTTNSFANFSKSRKRRADESHTHNQRASKKLKTLSRQFRKRHGSTRPGAQEGSKASSPPTPETEVQACPALQVCRYLLEMFSVPLLRSHATVCLIDRDRLQLYHANRSVILVSSAINFSNNEDLDKFIAVIFAFQRLTPEQNGILDAFPSSNIELVKNPNIPEDYRVVQNGNVLHLSTYNEEESFEISLGDVISRDPAVIGRSTVVLKATSDKWPDTNLVAKVSWPSSGRVSETKFIEKAIEEAEKTEGEWATNHLPRMFFSKEFVFNEKSTFESTARLFEASKFFPRNYAFERRVLRIIIQEELYPLKSLSNVRDLGQVFVDVACIHRWLHDVPGILHRDLSPNNIMCRWVEETDAEGNPEKKICGVLTDYDLSSWTHHLKKDNTQTSQHRTGTPPYMAIELLSGTSSTHLYRHDIESLFYVMLVTCCRDTFGLVQDETTKKPTGGVIMLDKRPPFQDWFGEQEYHKLGSYKRTFFSVMQAFRLPSIFKDFYPWLNSLQFQFSNGFRAKDAYTSEQEMVRRGGGYAGRVSQLDEETLGGRIRYSSFIEPVRRLTGALERLIILYDPPQSPLPALTGAIHANP